MTRWERLLDALGVDPDTWDRDHQASFDCSPKAWLKRQLEEIDREDGDEILPDAKCDAPCCAAP